jgi:hypothetical protein
MPSRSPRSSGHDGTAACPTIDTKVTTKIEAKLQASWKKAMRKGTTRAEQLSRRRAEAVDPG